MTEPILQAAWEGFLLVFSWPNILYPVVGTLAAMCFALLPGLTGATLMALAIPFTFSWPPLPVMLLFGAFVGGATFMGSVTAILFNIPGRTSSAATLLDGYPMARQGRARTAIACSATASALGSTFGVAILILLIPVMRETVLLFGPPEFLILTIWGLTTIALLSRGAFVKGLLAAGVGLLLSFVGFDPRTAELRYTADTTYLRDGIPLVPAFLGLFTLAEIMDLIASNRRTISGHAHVRDLSGSVWEGIRSVFVHFGVFLRSAVLGTVIGIIPGIGATVASFLAYEHAAHTAGKDGAFGKGDIRGVIAPEAAHDAKDGGSLVPTLAFGIPGGTGTAVLLAVFSVHGLTPGRDMLTDQLPLVFVLIWSLFLSNWLTSLLGLAAVHPLNRMTTIPIHLIIPPLLMAATVGAYMHQGRIEDVFLAYGFGLLGYAMKTFNWPRIPLVIALVLGPLFENSFHLTMRLQTLGRIDFFTRPVVLMLMALTVGSLAAPFLPVYRRRRERR
jgi:TctA family transporter